MINSINCVTINISIYLIDKDDIDDATYVSGVHRGAEITGAKDTTNIHGDVMVSE